MAFVQVQCFSEALNVATTVNVILPEAMQGIGLTTQGQAELPKVLYLLHGYSDDHSIWLRRTSVERYAAAHNLAVMMPAVNHSFYCNEVHGEKYWDYVSEELPRVMHRFFRLSEKPEDTFVAGLSMGGYGAMKLALSHPDRFATASSKKLDAPIIPAGAAISWDSLNSLQAIYATAKIMNVCNTRGTAISSICRGFSRMTLP